MEKEMTPDTQTITFRDSNPDPILIFRPDGTLWINPIYTTEEAAAKFWEIVQTMNPYPDAISAIAKQEEITEALKTETETLTVKQLIEQLQLHDQNAPVWVATNCHGCFEPAVKVSKDKFGMVVVEDKK